MCRSMVDIQSANAEIRRGRKEEDRRKNIMSANSASATQGDHKKPVDHARNAVQQRARALIERSVDLCV